MVVYKSDFGPKNENEPLTWEFAAQSVTKYYFKLISSLGKTSFKKETVIYAIYWEKYFLCKALLKSSVKKQHKIWDSSVERLIKWGNFPFYEDAILILRVSFFQKGF